jgi:oligosaccharyl transferase (archaeosortase A-associated)
LVQHVADHLRGKDVGYICIVCVPVFSIAVAMIVPALSFGFLSEFHAISLFIGIFVLLFLTALSFTMRRAKIKTYWYPIVILAMVAILLIILSAFYPALYSTLTEPLLHIFIPSKQYLTISEARPMEWENTWEWFTTTFFLAFAAFALIGYNISRQWRAEEILLFVWSAIILFACFGQNRFSAYYAVNVAILCGFLSWRIIEFVAVGGAEKGEMEMRGSRVQLEEEQGRKVKGKRKEKAIKTQKGYDTVAKGRKEEKKKFLLAYIVITFIVILFVVFYPPLNESIATAELGCGGPRDDWYESLSWMRESTPDPGVDYYALYPKEYNYPDSAYSVMSWWDYGNWITYIAHRIPIANNFQQGIGGPYQRNSPGACVFFIAKNESEANNVLNALDVRYVVTAFPLADAMKSYHNLYGAIAFWGNDSSGEYKVSRAEERTMFELGEEYFKTTVTKLHMFDGTGAQFKGGYLGKTSILLITPFQTEPQQHYRLVHESSTFMIPHVILNTETEDLQAWECYAGKNYTNAERLAHNLHHGFIARDDPNITKWSPPFISPVSFVKVFEYVKGARIKGRLPNGSIVGIATNITTNQGREFMYSQIAMPNGNYEFIVPYSTEGPIEKAGYTNFDVLAAPYAIRTGHKENETIVWDTSKELEVSEEEVMEGKTVIVDLV